MGKTRFGIYGQNIREEDESYLQELIEILERSEVSFSFYKPFYSKFKSRIRTSSNVSFFSDHKELCDLVDVVISLGGDGTILNVLTLVRDSGIPIAGVNMGRLGFLSSISKDNISKIVDEILVSKAKIEEKALIQLESSNDLFGEVNYAMNEFAIHKNDTSSMIVIHTYIDGDYLNSYWADGLIIATPTGSTAYSLSCGGPIIYPKTGCFVITPVAPHNLNLRPIVVSDQCTISFEIEGRSDHFLCTMDSRSSTIYSKTELAVKKASFNVKLIRLQEDDFKSTLRNKMMWGLDKRNYRS